MDRSTKVWGILILLFTSIGILASLRDHFWDFVIFFAIAGLLFYLYRKPPRWLLKFSSSKRAYRSPSSKSKQTHKKRHSFRVIDGKKDQKLR